MKRTNRLLTVAIGLVLMGVCACAQQVGSAQWSTNGHAYALASRGWDKAVAWYDAGKTAPRGWFGYGGLVGTDLTDGVPVGGFGAWGFYGFDRRSNWGLTGSAGYVWPQQGKGATVFGIGIGIRT